MRLLDLFCGAGGAAMGYHRAGFEVVGVDIAPQPNYPFLFFEDDALAAARFWLFDDCPFDAVHASPPCQAYTTMNNRHASSSPALIDDVRELLMESGLPFVIENVVGAKSAMRSPITLRGEQFGLGVYSPRLFESNMLLYPPAHAPRKADPVAVYGKQDGRRLFTRKDGTELRVANLEQASEAMGIDWMTWEELREAIPPAYTQFVGEQLIVQLAAPDEGNPR